MSYGSDPADSMPEFGRNNFDNAAANGRIFRPAASRNNMVSAKWLEMIDQKIVGGLRLTSVLVALVLGACSGVPLPWSGPETLPTVPVVSGEEEETPLYRIGSDDQLQIFVWRNGELSTSVQVRPDGLITIPLIEDLPAVGKTPTELARDVEKALSKYIQDPIVTIMVRGFIGPFADKVRIVGEAARPQALPYRSTMTLLDVMIQVGGITQFAAGNRATITRVVEGAPKQYRIYIDDLLRNGDISANVKILPGDIIVVPEAWF